MACEFVNTAPPNMPFIFITHMYVSMCCSGTTCLYLFPLKQAEQTKAPRAPALLGITILLMAALELFPSTVSESSSHVSDLLFVFLYMF